MQQLNSRRPESVVTGTTSPSRPLVPIAHLVHDASLSSANLRGAFISNFFGFNPRSELSRASLAPGLRHTVYA